VPDSLNTNADPIPNFGVPCIPRAGLHRHGLGVIIRLGELCWREYWSALYTKAVLAYVGFVSDAHSDPCLHSEEPCRPLLDLLDGDAVRERVVAGLE